MMCLVLDIPEDVLVAARRAALSQYDADLDSHERILRGEADTWPIVKVAVRAILAERERWTDGSCVQVPTSVEQAGLMISVAENYLRWHAVEVVNA